MTQTTAIQIVKVEDHEGDGRCSSCNREGLRWVVTLSDGTMVGTECSKKILGIKVAPADHRWTRDFTPADQRTTDGGTIEVLWQHKTRNVTALTRDGHLTTMGGARKEWERG